MPAKQITRLKPWAIAGSKIEWVLNGEPVGENIAPMVNVLLAVNEAFKAHADSAMNEQFTLRADDGWKSERPGGDEVIFKVATFWRSHFHHSRGQLQGILFPVGIAPHFKAIAAKTRDGKYLILMLNDTDNTVLASSGLRETAEEAMREFDKDFTNGGRVKTSLNFSPLQVPRVEEWLVGMLAPLEEPMPRTE